MKTLLDIGTSSGVEVGFYIGGQMAMTEVDRYFTILFSSQEQSSYTSRNFDFSYEKRLILLRMTSYTKLCPIMTRFG